MLTGASEFITSLRPGVCILVLIFSIAYNVISPEAETVLQPEQKQAIEKRLKTTSGEDREESSKRLAERSSVIRFLRILIIIVVLLAPLVYLFLSLTRFALEKFRPKSLKTTDNKDGNRL